MNVVYRVYITEHERGWGQRPDGHHDFTGKTAKVDAEAFADKINAENNLPQVPDVYWTASKPALVDLDA